MVGTFQNSIKQYYLIKREIFTLEDFASKERERDQE